MLGKPKHDEEDFKITLNNPYTMKHEDLIFLPFAVLAAVVLILAIIAVRKFKQLETDEDPVPYDDMPARYEDYELSERPYIEML